MKKDIDIKDIKDIVSAYEILEERIKTTGNKHENNFIRNKLYEINNKDKEILLLELYKASLSVLDAQIISCNIIDIPKSDEYKLFLELNKKHWFVNAIFMRKQEVNGCKYL